MLGYYKRRILQLSDKLTRLRHAPDDMARLLELQTLVLERILYTETRINAYKARLAQLKSALKNKHPDRAQSESLRAEIKTVDRKIQSSKWLLYVWRCFGDGIAFTYLDKWSLKAALFNLDNPRPKQQAGNLSGKPGLQDELTVLKETIGSGIPALLTDLTNTIRHGDVCLLIGPDPWLIEVKSSKNRNARTERQIDNIRRIHDFLERDIARNWHGATEVIRRKPELPEQNYCHRVDAAVRTALAIGTYHEALEPGTHLIAFRSNMWRHSHKMLHGIRSPQVFLLNEAKNGKAWGSYYPFTLTLDTPSSLYAFLHGDVFILAVFDLEAISEMAATLGLQFEVRDDQEVPYRLKLTRHRNAEYPSCGISSHFAMRIGLELLSWRWILESQAIHLGELVRYE